MFKRCQNKFECFIKNPAIADKKLLISFMLLISLWFIKAVMVLAILDGLLLFLLLFSGILWRGLKTILLIAGISSGLLFLIQLLADNILYGEIVLLQMIFIIFCSGLLMATTKEMDFIYGVQKCLIYFSTPSKQAERVSLIFFIALRAVTIIYEQYQQIRMAQKARGLESNLLAIAIPLLIKMFKAANSMAETLMAKGFDDSLMPIGHSVSKILVYHFFPEGTTRSSFEEMEKMLKRFNHSTQYVIKKVTGKYLQEKDWEKDTALLIIPGGRARVNYKNIGDIGNDKIKRFVESGGYYLGICGGGYYGAAKTVFEKNGPLEILDEGPLYFYQGTAQGPAYGLSRFRYRSEAGAQLSTVHYQFLDGSSRSIPMYFNGGCFFHHSKNDQTTVIGKFEDIEEAPPAIIECKVGLGLAILSGVHFEFTSTAKNLQNAKMLFMKEALDNSQEQRDKVLLDILKRLKLV